MDELLEQFKNKRPEIVFEWNDPITEAEGWVVINSLRGGAAGGGTRMRKGLDRHEVESLAKIMEIKFTVSGPAIGGAKSGINFDPNDPRKNEVLDRWFQYVTPLLKNYYGTGGDLNIDEVKDVIPLTEDYGLWHPQEGIVTGHFKPNEKDKIHIIGQLRQGVSKKIEDPRYSPEISKKYTIADMITGYGVSEAVKHQFALFNNENIEGKKAIIQGWGNVAGAAAFYLAQNGVKIVGIIDRNGGIIDENGLDFETVKQLFINRKSNELVADNLLSFEVANEKIWDIEADIFIPGAASRLLKKEQVDRLIAKGTKVISCGANVPFVEEGIFFGSTTEYVDNQLSLIPDFIANCGMARVFAYLMQAKANEITDEAIFSDTSETIYAALKKVHDTSKKQIGITRTALNQALKILLSN